MRTVRPAFAARAAVAALLGFLVLVAVLHLLRPEYDPRSRWLSEYAVGRYGWIMNTAFLSLAFAEVMLVTGILEVPASSRWLRLGAVCLGLAAVAMALLAVFPTDVDLTGQGGPRVRTAAGRSHDLVGPLHGYALLSAMGCWAVAFGRLVAWRKLVGPTVIVATMMVANHVLAPLLIPRAWAGLSQRLAVVLAVVWLGLVADHLLRHMRAAGHRPAGRSGPASPATLT